MLTRWKNYFCQLLNVQGPGDIRQTEIHTAETFVPGPSAAEVEVAIRKIKRYKAPGSDQIQEELIQAGGETLHSEIHKLIKLIWNKEELPYQWKESIVVPINKKGDKTDISNYRGISLLSTSYKIVKHELILMDRIPVLYNRSVVFSSRQTATLFLHPTWRRFIRPGYRPRPLLINTAARQSNLSS
jgi:hypothetical protein